MAKITKRDHAISRPIRIPICLHTLESIKKASFQSKNQVFLKANLIFVLPDVWRWCKVLKMIKIKENHQKTQRILKLTKKIWYILVFCSVQNNWSKILESENCIRERRIEFPVNNWRIDFNLYNNNNNNIWSCFSIIQ